MPHITPLDYDQAPAAAREVFDEIKQLRKVEDVNNFWKYLAHHPTVLRRTWDSLKQVMAPGALDPLTKEMIYMAISMSNGCDYCIKSHTAQARAKGMTETCGPPITLSALGAKCFAALATSLASLS